MPDLITADLDEASNGTQTAGFDMLRTSQTAALDAANGRIAGQQGAASGRTGVRSHSRHSIASATLPRIEAAFARVAAAHSSGIPALRRPSYIRSFISTRGGSPPCAE